MMMHAFAERCRVNICRVRLELDGNKTMSDVTVVVLRLPTHCRIPRLRGELQEVTVSYRQHPAVCALKETIKSSEAVTRWNEPISGQDKVRHNTSDTPRDT
eukprot:TRINITY_DN88311_c0_g1_i1.p1 TRINITY_DN88311_c0_g1~~TRINITY_DN88311_c0_g1_i1.p1  ORF type:complete len:101 (+),score=2.12 TRINITY_DN88311_c0_g1_i1:320-622(+)